MDSILLSIKKLSGIDQSFHDFDPDLITLINAELMGLNHKGIGKQYFFITGETETWNEFLEGAKDLNAVMTYVYLRVRLVFDPPASSAVKEAYDARIKEFEYLLYVNEDNKRYLESEGKNA